MTEVASKQLGSVGAFFSQQPQKGLGRTLHGAVGLNVKRIERDPGGMILDQRKGLVGPEVFRRVSKAKAQQR